MEISMKEALERVMGQMTLTREETEAILVGITEGKYQDAQIAALLTALQMRGITVDELLGLRDGILATGVSVPLQAERFIDIVGTGGDQKNTFNISTCACFVVAGAGYKVVKHGNYAATSVSGASNVIEQHGVKFTADAAALQRSLDEAGIAYLHAPLFARAMKFVAPVRKALQVPTCFNLLGPLVNPARPGCQLLGVANLAQMRLYNEVYRKMGIDYCIETSIDGYDEISLTGDFKIMTGRYERIFKPEELGLSVADAADLRGGDTKEEAAAIFDSILEDRGSLRHKEVVIANAAFAIETLDPARPLAECVAMARESIESGRALSALKKFVELNS